MKQLSIIIAVSINMLTVCLIVTLSFIRFQIDTLDGNFTNNMYDYIPVPLIVIVILSFLFELYIIIKKKKSN